MLSDYKPRTQHNASKHSFAKQRTGTLGNQHKNVGTCYSRKHSSELRGNELSRFSQNDDPHFKTFPAKLYSNTEVFHSLSCEGS